MLCTGLCFFISFILLPAVCTSVLPHISTFEGLLGMNVQNHIISLIIELPFWQEYKNFKKGDCQWRSNPQMSLNTFCLLGIRDITLYHDRGHASWSICPYRLFLYQFQTSPQKHCRSFALFIAILPFDNHFCMKFVYFCWFCWNNFLDSPLDHKTLCTRAFWVLLAQGEKHSC